MEDTPVAVWASETAMAESFVEIQLRIPVFTVMTNPGKARRELKGKIDAAVDRLRAELDRPELRRR